MSLATSSLVLPSLTRRVMKTRTIHRFYWLPTAKSGSANGSDAHGMQHRLRDCWSERTLIIPAGVSRIGVVWGSVCDELQSLASPDGRVDACETAMDAES